MNSSFCRFLHSRRELFVIGLTGSTLAIDRISRMDSSDALQLQSKSSLGLFNASHCTCDSARDPSFLSQQQRNEKPSPIPARSEFHAGVSSPSLWRRLLAPIGILPLPRLLTPNDPVFKLSKRFLRQREMDDEKMRKISAIFPKLRGSPEEKVAKLRQEIFEVAYGKGVTPQMREDFVIRYGCTGFNDAILKRLVELCATRGMVEVGAGHGQWQRALTDAYIAAHDEPKNGKKFDFVLAYDDNSNLPLNTHIYNQYTKPHHGYFGSVQKVDSTTDLSKVLRSWACRGRALLMVYPPPGPMAIDTLKIYSEASPENDTIIYVGEGKGGANANDAFFDFLETNGWVLLEILEVLRPPGDKSKGCERLYILQKVREHV